MKLNSIARWSELPPEASVVFEGRKARRIRLHVNSPGLARFWLIEDGKERFLGAVERCDVIEFVASGDVEIATKDSDVWYYCAEHEPTHTKILDPKIFTRIAERRTRNPELELMMHQMQVNLERRLAAQNFEFNSRMEAALAAREARNEPVSEAPGTVAKRPEQEVDKPDPDNRAPGKSTPKAEEAADEREPGDDE